MRQARRGRSDGHYVLITQKFPSPGGAQKSLVYHLELLNRDMYSPRVLVSKEGWLTDKLSSMGIPWDLIPFGHWTNLGSLPKNLLLIWKLVNYLHKHEIDLVHANEHWIAPQCLIAARLVGIPIICHFRTGLEDLTRARIRKYLFSHYDRVVVVADILKKALDSRIPDPGRVVVIRDGVKTFVAEPLSLSTRKAKVVINVGTIYEVKGQAKILEKAIPWLKESCLHFLFFVGDIRKDPGYVARLKEIVATHSLKKQVLFFGIRHDIERFLRAADVLVAFSKIEGVPRVVMEAMLAGRPVLVSNTPGMDEVVKDGIVGKILDFDDPINPFWEALKDMERNYPKWQSMGTRARERAISFYSARAMSDAIQSIYNQLIS